MSSRDTEVGRVSLGLDLNTKSMNSQISSAANQVSARMGGALKKIGAAFGAALSVKALAGFGKKCIELGSDLAEVQNVVDVTFSSMSDKVDQFAKSAAKQFGLSETMAKRYTGTFGAMSKAFGFSEQQAYSMSTALTGLAGDVASFYNITQDEAYTKLKSVFTGETESLKDLGVVMTQTALDQFALSNGFGKTTKAMTEQEKVALRYAFVQKQLATASGDFARTSDGWANQIRILNLQFESLKATIGQALINVLTPVLKLINTLIGRVAVLAEHFKAFTEMLTGQKSSGGSGLGAAATAAMDVMQNTEGAADAADTLADSTRKAGDAAKKAAKAARGLMGFDQINKLSEPEESAAGSSVPTTPAGASGVNIPSVDYGSLAKGETAVGKLNSAFGKLAERVRELGGLFRKGFQIGFGDSDKKIEAIRKNLQGIGKSLVDIWTDPSVQTAANRLLDSIALSAGKIAGSMVRIGLTIAENLTGGFNQYLESSSTYIKTRIAEIFNVSAEIATQVGDFAVAIADIFDVFSGPEATSCTANIIGIFSDGFLGATGLGLKFVRDITTLVTQPIIDNTDQIRLAIENTLGPISVVLDTIHTSVRNTFTKIHTVYDQHIQPLYQSITEGVSEVVGTLLDGYNTYIAPVLTRCAQYFKEVWTSKIQPGIDEVIEAVGDIADSVKILWEKNIQPFINWVAKVIWPLIAPVVEMIAKSAINFIGNIATAVGGLATALAGVIKFLTGVFTGDWDRAWAGIKQTFTGIWEAMPDVLKTAVNKVIGFANSFLGALERMVNGVAGALNSITIDIPDWLQSITGYSSVGFNLPYWTKPTIPYLAEGAYVKKNTPQLAVVGDNRTQGEIVAPERKLMEMAQMAANSAGGYDPRLYDILLSILRLLQGTNLVQIDPESLRKYFIRQTNDRTRMNTGKSELLF